MGGDELQILTAPDEDAKVWRYTSLAKFLNVLRRGADSGEGELITKRADAFEDEYEGTLSSPSRQDIASEAKGAYDATYDLSFDLERDLHNPEERELARKDLRLGPQRWVKNARDSFYRMRELTFVNCWRLDEYESSNMWRAYTTQTDGLVVKSSFGSLVDSARKWEGKLYCGKVEYIDYNLGRMFEKEIDVIKPFFFKRRQFGDESEVRLAVTDYSSQTVDMVKGTAAMPEPSENRIRPIAYDIDKLVDEIRVHPHAGGFVADLLDDALHRFGLDVPVVSSSLRE